MIATEGVTLLFKEDAIAEIAEVAAVVNERTENIGARRLYTIMETLLDEISFNAPEMAGQEVVIDASYVKEKLENIIEDEDLSRYIL
jgi:ATP-dependent HslUV protease ATP-binding subunit HslU